MTLVTDGNMTWLEDIAPPAILPEVKKALEGDERVFIDFDTLPVTTSAKLPAIGSIILIGGLLAVGLVLVMRRK